MKTDKERQQRRREKLRKAGWLFFQRWIYHEDEPEVSEFIDDLEVKHKRRKP